MGRESLQQQSIRIEHRSPDANKRIHACKPADQKEQLSADGHGQRNQAAVPRRQFLRQPVPQLHHEPQRHFWQQLQPQHEHEHEQPTWHAA